MFIQDMIHKIMLVSFHIMIFQQAGFSGMAIACQTTDTTPYALLRTSKTTGFIQESALFQLKHTYN